MKTLINSVARQILHLQGWKPLDLQDLSSKLVTRVHCQALKRGYERVYMDHTAFKDEAIGQYDEILMMSQTLLVSNEAENTYKWID